MIRAAHQWREWGHICLLLLLWPPKGGRGGMVVLALHPCMGMRAYVKVHVLPS